MLEIVKNIAAVVGCISACITLATLIVKPLRQRVVDSFTKKSQEKQINTDITNIKSKMAELNGKLDKVLANDEHIQNRLTSVEKNVLENEADRLKTELFDCGNRCRRGIYLHAEEFEHIRSVYRKYSNVLHCNSDGTNEWSFIFKYYNDQELKDHRK